MKFFDFNYISLYSKPKFGNNDLIESLREETGFLAEKYNEKLKENEEFKKKEEATNLVRKEKPLQMTSRAGGVYVPPHKLRQM